MWFDTMMAWHTLFSELRKDLGTLTSILTEEPYYKSEGREYNPKKDSFDKLMSYNAKDAYATWECYERIHEMLIAEKMEEFYFEKAHPLNELYSRIEDCGLLVNTERRRFLLKSYKEKLEDKKRQMNEAISMILGEALEYNFNSPKQIAELLYGQFRIPLRKDTGEDTLKALVNNVIKDPIKKKTVELIMECRKISKMINTYIDFELH